VNATGGAARGTRLVTWAVIAASVAGIGLSRSWLFPRFLMLREKSDVYALPSPDQVVVASLGYRSALADLLFAHVLVWHGLHFQEKRVLEFAADYLDTVSALDPTFRETYYYGDTLIAMRPIPPTREDYWRARKLLEKGLANRPGDTELWLSAGQFMAYVAAPWLDDEKEKAEWRLAGARVLARACELVGSNERVPFHCITAASLFTKAGEREATIQFLERVLAVSDDDEIRDLATRYLQVALGEQARNRLQVRANRLREAWRQDLPFVNLTQELVLGPPIAADRCAGLGQSASACATTWHTWRERVEAENPTTE
jgi:tetratricopeptide (TPR) repeat protein